MDQREVRRYLNVIKRAVVYIEGMLDADDGGLLEQMAHHAPVPQAHHQAHVPVQQPVVVQQPPQPVFVEQPVVIVPTSPPPPPPPVPQGPSPEEIKRFEEARKKHIGDLMNIDCWPEAVPTFLMAKESSVQDQVNRANAVLDMMLDRSIEGAHFLDFGCGDGWIAQEATKRGVIESWGHDIVESKNWASLKGPKMTTDPNAIKKNYFDVIMLYDVLDHCEDPLAVMNHVKSLLKKTGAVYVRCHPWTSKHASHIYKQGVNKAYLHLFLKYHEIKELVNGEPMFTREEKGPLEAYRYWFSNFEIKKERAIREPVSDFFHVPAFKDLLRGEQQIEDIDGFLKLMEIQFVDYVLVPKN